MSEYISKLFKFIVHKNKGDVKNESSIFQNFSSL